MYKKILCLILVLCISIFSGCSTSQYSTNTTLAATESSKSNSKYDNNGDIGNRTIETPRTVTEKYSDRPIQEQTDGNDDISTIEMLSTPNSTAFSEVGYDSANNILYVRFREKDALYAYYGFNDWENFRNADSLGRYHNEYIRGYYDYERIQ